MTLEHFAELFLWFWLLAGWVLFTRMVSALEPHCPICGKVLESTMYEKGVSDCDCSRKKFRTEKISWHAG